MLHGSLHPKLSNGNKYFKPQHIVGLEQESSSHSHGETTEMEERAIRESPKTSRGSLRPEKRVDKSCSIRDPMLLTEGDFEHIHPTSLD